MRPTRTGMPKALLASDSRRGRKSSIRGTITACSKPQVAPNNSPIAMTTHNTQRVTAAHNRSPLDGAIGALMRVWLAAEVSIMGKIIMTVSITGSCMSAHDLV